MVTTAASVAQNVFVPSLGNALGAHIGAATAFVQSSDSSVGQNQDLFTRAGNIASAYGLTEIPQQNSRVAKIIFANELKPRFDSAVSGILDHRFPSETEFVDTCVQQQLDRIDLGAAVAANLLDRGLAKAIRSRLPQATMSAVESSRAVATGALRASRVIDITWRELHRFRILFLLPFSYAMGMTKDEMWGLAPMLVTGALLITVVFMFDIGFPQLLSRKYDALSAAKRKISQYGGLSFRLNLEAPDDEVGGGRSEVRSKK